MRAKHPSSLLPFTGPFLTLLLGITLIVLARNGIVVPFNEGILFSLATLSTFYFGIPSGIGTLLVATILFTATVIDPASFPVFYEKNEVVALGIVLPLVILVLGSLKKKLDRRVKESEDGYRTVVENIDEVFFLISIDFRKLYYISPAYEKVWGRPVSGFYDDPGSWFDAIHPEDRDSVMEYTNALIANTWPSNRRPDPYRVIQPGGTIRWIAPKAIILNDAHGKPDRFVGIALDITSEMASAAAEQQMSKRLRSVLENAPIAIFSTDKDGLLTLREGKGGARAGVKPGQGIGTSYFKQFEDVPEHVENVRRALAGESFTASLQVRNGIYEIAYAPVMGRDGMPNGMVGVATDITERQNAEKQVGELSLLKNKFITVATHQLRTPLSVIRWNLERLLDGELGKLTKAQKEFLRVTFDADIEVITRINDFMLALDIEEGAKSINAEKTSLKSLWESVMIAARKKCAIKGLDLEYADPGDLPAVTIDQDKIRTVMEKLVENAVQYTPTGSIKVEIGLQGNAKVRFAVSDTGIGVPAAEQGKVFRRFFRASNAMLQRTDSNGLGLHIAKHYVEMHNGSIGFSSQEGKGSTFWFELPI
jgi:PAS domain S-box-containing protein